jgi:3-dehydroquinate dehydratase/shikimate dehydrogenase
MSQASQNSTLPVSAPLARVRREKLCVAIQAKTVAEMLELATQASADAHFLEFRLDSLAKPAEALQAVRQFLLNHQDVSAIATCRRKKLGGAFTGTMAEELILLRKAAEAGCALVDLEIESAEAAKKADLAAFRSALKAAGAALLISFHDFAKTQQLIETSARIEAFRPDYVKIVSTARSLKDNLAILRLIEEKSRTLQIVGIAMGEEGMLSRILGIRSGGAFTFAAPSEGDGTAPGQLSMLELRTIYRAEQLDRATRLFGVAGNPVAHSLSPLMHNTAFHKASINAVLLPLKVRSVSDFIKVLRELPLAGAAVTMPLKQEVLPHLANTDPLTRRIGACNTLRIGADGKIVGFNTDVAGIIRPLEKRLKLKGARIAVLGAGGAARAAVFGLIDQGAEVYIVNRTHESAVALARKAKAKTMKHEVFAKNHFDVLINSTPCGMKDAKQAMPIKESELNAGLVFDMVYNPLETPLLKLARSRGIPVITGLEMFVQQGARQFEIWTGQPAPEAEMLRAVQLELSRRA